MGTLLSTIEAAGARSRDRRHDAAAVIIGSRNIETNAGVKTSIRKRDSCGAAYEKCYARRPKCSLNTASHASSYHHAMESSIHCEIERVRRAQWHNRLE